jgi:hypothetical protein
VAIRKTRNHYPEAVGLLTVDPGMHTGWAMWDGTLMPVVDAFHVGNKTVNRDEDKLAWLWNAFEDLITKTKPKLVIIEGVEYWQGNFKSDVSARNQDLVKLSYLAGGYGLICTKKKIPWAFVPAPKWKGQMNKEATMLRVRRATGQTYVGSHRTDAVGIGLSFMGVL